ncbi:MAG: autotransporter outer membrane beta-barrel domain-containing protein [Alphaproteobacteria bacterium]|nr:autotransporter outer membrane beta-barrel domain-containing protein [Alphaproteobacteria bacterium]
MTLTIADDDETPTVTLALSRSSISENGGTATVTARQDRASSAATVVRVSASPTPPAKAGDYRLSAGPVLTVPAGRTASTGTVTIAAVDNAVAEPDKTVSVSATARNAQGVTGPEPVTLAIEDDDAPGSRGRLNRVARELLPRVSQAMADSALAAVRDRLGSAPSCMAAANLAGQTSLLRALESNAHALEDGSLRPEQALSGTSFVLPLSDRIGPTELACIWGSGDYRAMAGGGDRVVRWDGDIFGARLGADVRMRDDILAGAALSWSKGGFDWTDRGGGKPVDGTYESRVTSVHPYVGWSAHEDLRIWAAAGLGAGEIEIDDAEASMRMAAAGASAELLADDRLIAGGTTLLRLKTEGFLARAAVEGAGWVDPFTVDTTRLRLTLEASHARQVAGGGQWTPMLEVGARHDGGDGETGFGLELGGGLRYEDPALGLTAEGRARVLATRRQDYEEWGIGGLVRLDPGADETGWSFSLMPTWGEAAGGARELWDRGVAAAEAADRTAPAGRVETEVGYGLPAFDGGGIVTPYTGFSLTDESRDWLAGTRFRIGALDADLSGSLAQSASGESDYRVSIALSLPLGGGGSSGGSRQLEERQSRPMSAQPAPRSGTNAPARAELGAPSSSAAAQPAPAPAPGPVAQRPSGPRAPARVGAEPFSAPRWRVQLGAFSREANAVRTRTALSTALDDVLVRARHALVIDRSKGDGLARVVIDDAFAVRGAAAALCAAIKARGPDCYVAPSRRSGTRAPARAELGTRPSSAPAQSAPAPGPVAKQPSGPRAPGRVAVASTEAVAEPSAPRWRVQLGAFSREANAVRTRIALSTALGDILVRTRHALVVDGSKAGGLARVVIDDAFTERGPAAALCAAIKARGPDCYVAPLRR